MRSNSFKSAFKTKNQISHEVNQCSLLELFTLNVLFLKLMFISKIRSKIIREKLQKKYLKKDP